MSDYETQRQRHLTYAMALAPRLIERLDWPADRLAAHRAQRLREVVRDAIDRSPWHRERLPDVDPDRLDEASLRELPPMTKTDLMENFDRIVTDDRLSLELVNDHLETVTTGSYLLDGYTAVTSGGSTGERGVFVYDWEGWATFWVSCSATCCAPSGRSPSSQSRPVVLGWVAAAHFTHATAALSRTFTSPDFVNVRFPVTLATEEIVAGLNEAQPDFLLAYPSALHVLSFEARAGRLRIAPRQILSCSEPLLPEIRSAAEEAWGVRVGNAWGTSEGGGVGIPCEHSRLAPERGPADRRAGRRARPAGRTGRALGQALPDEPVQPGAAADPLRDHRRGDDPAPSRARAGRRTGAWPTSRAGSTTCSSTTAAASTRMCSAPRSVATRGWSSTRCARPRTARASRCAAADESTSTGSAPRSRDALDGLGVPRPTVDVTAVERLERDPGPAKLRRFVPLDAEPRALRVPATAALDTRPPTPPSPPGPSRRTRTTTDHDLAVQPLSGDDPVTQNRDGPFHDPFTAPFHLPLVCRPPRSDGPGAGARGRSAGGGERSRGRR